MSTRMNIFIMIMAINARHTCNICHHAGLWLFCVTMQQGFRHGEESVTSNFAFLKGSWFGTEGDYVHCHLVQDLPPLSSIVGYHPPAVFWPHPSSCIQCFLSNTFHASPPSLPPPHLLFYLPSLHCMILRLPCEHTYDIVMLYFV